MAAHHHMPGFICLSSKANERIDGICVEHAEEREFLLQAKEELVQEVDEGKATLVAVKDQLGGVCDLARATAERLEQEAALLAAAAADRAALLEFAAQLQSDYSEQRQQLVATKAARDAAEALATDLRERLGFSEAGRAAATQRAEEAAAALAAERQQSAQLQQQLSEAAAALAAEREQHDQVQQQLSEQLAEAAAALAAQRQDAEGRAAGLQERLGSVEAGLAAAAQRANEAATALASERQQSARLRQQLAELRAAHAAGAQQYAQLQQHLAASEAARAGEAQRATWLQASLERTSWLMAEADAGRAAEARHAAELQRRVKDLELGDDIAFRAVNIVRAAVEADAARARTAFRCIVLRKIMHQNMKELCRKLAESRRGPADQDESGEESPVVA